jgi:hypothetical protein
MIDNPRELRLCMTGDQFRDRRPPREDATESVRYRRDSIKQVIIQLLRVFCNRFVLLAPQGMDLTIVDPSYLAVKES